MILVDTSVWVDHFRTTIPTLAALAANGEVLSHRFIEGELALGHIRADIITMLRESAAATIVSHDDVMRFIARAELAGSGIGYVDAHLLASTLVTPDALLWTRDKRLRAVAERLGVAAYSR